MQLTKFSMKKSVYIILLSVVYSFSQAQQNTQPTTNASALSVGLKQAIEVGLKNRYDVQSHKYKAAIASTEVNKSKKEWVPDISGSAMARYNPQIQATYIPGGFFWN